MRQCGFRALARRQPFLALTRHPLRLDRAEAQSSAWSDAQLWPRLRSARNSRLRRTVG
jgi:hypothetical protein